MHPSPSRSTSFMIFLTFFSDNFFPNPAIVFLNSFTVINPFPSLSNALNAFLNCSEHTFSGSSVCYVIMLTNSENSIAPVPEKFQSIKYISHPSEQLFI